MQSSPALVDYASLARRWWWLVMVCTLGGAFVGLLYVVRVPSTFKAVAEVRFRPPADYANEVGVVLISKQTPHDVAVAASARALSSAALAGAARILGDGTTVRRLRKEADAQLDPATNHVRIAVTSSDQAVVAPHAIALARAVTAVEQTAVRARYLRAAHALTARLAATNGSQRAPLAVQLTRVQTLARLAIPAVVAGLPSPPRARDRPVPPFDIAFGSAAGLMLGLGLAWLAEVWRVLGGVDRGRGIPTGPETIRWRAAGDEGVEDAAQSARLALGDLPEGAIIGVVSPWPEEGRTTIATCLVEGLARSGRRVLLVEADLRRPVLARRLGITGTGGLVDALRDGRPPLPVALSRNGAAFSVIAAGDAAHVASSADVAALADWLREAARSEDVIVVDTPPANLLPDTLELLPVFNARVVVLGGPKARPGLAGLTEALGRVPGASVTVVREALGRPSRTAARRVRAAGGPS